LDCVEDSGILDLTASPERSRRRDLFGDVSIIDSVMGDQTIRALLEE
jgi:hypothetical protein